MTDFEDKYLYSNVPKIIYFFLDSIINIEIILYSQRIYNKISRLLNTYKYYSQY